MVRKDLVKDPKWLEKIQIKNDVVFCTVFLDEEDCRELLQRILGMHIVKLKVVLNQKAIQNNIFQKGTRLDIYAEDDKGNMYDIEMQLTKTRELVPRSRYYHCEMDGHQIATGETYEELKQSIVIFLCEFDLFHKDQSVYTFEMRCNEDPTICLDEKRKTIFVNLHGKRDGLSEKLRNLLDYLETSVPTDEFTKSLERKVEEVKSNDEWRDNFVTLEQKIQLEVREASERAREAALVEGHAEGHARGLAEGHAEGIAEGRLEGAEINLLAQISKKLAKGKSVAQIADECEETEERIRELMKKL